MSKRYVVIAKTVTIVNRKTGEPHKVRNVEGGPLVDSVWSGEDFALDLLTPALARGGGPKALRHKREVEAKFCGIKEGDVVELDLGDYEILRRELDAIQWAPAFAPFADQLLPHCEAWEAAAHQDEAWKVKHE